MVEFTKLKFDNTSLLVDVAVEIDNPYWENTTIERVLIVEAEGMTFTETTPTNIDSKYIVFDVDLSSAMQSFTTYEVLIDKDSTAMVGGMIKKTFDEFKDKGLAVWVKCDYSVGSAIPPCGADQVWHMAFVYNKCPIINEIVKTSKEVERPCEIPKSFIDTLLRYAAFNYAILAKDWERVIKFWNKFYTKIGKHITTKCGCHG